MSGVFVSRAGEKLDAALDEFEVDVRGFVCADFGCNVGGFTDCLLRRGAAKVYAIDTGYGELAWTLRKDARVTVLERTNALHCPVSEAVDLVVVDVAWTPQELVVQAALKWLKPAQAGQDGGQVISLLKPHYELTKISGRKPVKALSQQQADEVCLKVCGRIEEIAPCRVRAVMRSVLKGKGGNVEYLLLISPDLERMNLSAVSPPAAGIG